MTTIITREVKFMLGQDKRTTALYDFINELTPETKWRADYTAKIERNRGNL